MPIGRPIGAPAWADGNYRGWGGPRDSDPASATIRASPFALASFQTVLRESPQGLPRWVVLEQCAIEARTFIVAVPEPGNPLR